MAGASFSVLLLLVALSFLGCEASSYLVPGNNTGIAIPTFVSDTGGMFYDVYADQSRNVFLILAGNGLYQMDYARTTLLAHHSFRDQISSLNRLPQFLHPLLLLRTFHPLRKAGSSLWETAALLSSSRVLLSHSFASFKTFDNDKQNNSFREQPKTRHDDGANCKVCGETAMPFLKRS